MDHEARCHEDVNETLKVANDTAQKVRLNDCVSETWRDRDEKKSRRAGGVRI
jgi:hypothetical protein